MSSNKKFLIEQNRIEESKDNNENKNSDNNKNLYLKYIALKNALIVEKQKTSILEKENKSLIEENSKKDEIISELKDEIKRYHDSINNKNSNFFSELFQNMNISDIKNEISINKLTNENLNLKEQISNLKNDLITSKADFEKKFSQLIEKNNDLEKKVQSYETQIKSYEKDKDISKQKLFEHEKRIINLEEAIRAIGNDKKYLEENLNKLKNEIKRKNEEMDKIFKDQENIMNNNTEFRQKINNLKNIINQYKKAIENNIEIKEDYIFIGKIIPNTHYNNIINIDEKSDTFLKMENKINNIDNYKTVKIIFNFNQKKIKFCIENKNPINIEVKNIIDIVENLHIEGQIKIFYKIKDNVYDYLCQFTKKEAYYIIHFYKELKNNDSIDPALYAAYLGTQ